MMKRWISLALSLLMLLTLAPTALAAETKPVPPAWVKAEEYAVFEGDSTYTGETWETVLRRRAIWSPSRGTFTPTGTSAKRPAPRRRCSLSWASSA